MAAPGCHFHNATKQPSVHEGEASTRRHAIASFAPLLRRLSLLAALAAAGFPLDSLAQAAWPDRALELIAHAKAHRGNGSPGHPGGEYLNSQTGMDGTHLPYRGDAPLVTDVPGGLVDVGVLRGSSAVAQASNGHLRLLAVTPRETADFIRRERGKWDKVVRVADLKLTD